MKRTAADLIPMKDRRARPALCDCLQPDPKELGWQRRDLRARPQRASLDLANVAWVQRSRDKYQFQGGPCRNRATRLRTSFPGPDWSLTGGPSAARGWLFFILHPSPFPKGIG